MAISGATENRIIDSEAIGANKLKWTQLNRILGARIKSKELHLAGLPDWEWDILKQYTIVAADQGDSAVSALEFAPFYLPLRAQWAALHMLRRLGEWQQLLKLEKISAKSQLR
jgi:hypothetical protein